METEYTVMKKLHQLAKIVKKTLLLDLSQCLSKFMYICRRFQNSTKFYCNNVKIMARLRQVAHICLIAITFLAVPSFFSF